MSTTLYRAFGTAMHFNAQAPPGRGRPATTPDDGSSKQSASTIQHDQVQSSSCVRQRDSGWSR